MNHNVYRTLLVAASSAWLACGQAPPADPAPAVAAPRLQAIEFTGSASPATGRFQIAAGLQAAIGTITEDANGNPATVSPDTAQVYGPSVTFATGGVGYPAACNPLAPYVMSANVEVFSGFKEQLRNVYARVTSVSGGSTFCSRDSSGAFSATLDPSPGLYFYQPLDAGLNAASTMRRTVQWAMNLPDNGTFWFTGTLYAEVIPQPPTALVPVDDAAIGPPRVIKFTWTDDPRADGLNTGENYLVPRPTGGALFSLLECGVGTAPYDPASCTTVLVNQQLVTTGTYTRNGTAKDRWYQWTLQTSFLLPGSTTRTIGSTVLTRHFRTY